MLSKSMYTEEYIIELQNRTGNDPTLLERAIYAFGLLEALRKTGFPFCFKGGTCLMLLLEHPRRLSTDIDIIVNPSVDIDSYIKNAGEIFPFLGVEEDIRSGVNNIVKRHFRFKFQSPRTKRDITILMDVLFEEIQYEKTVLKPIKNEFLLTEGEDLTVTVPDVNSVLGDKLTAFAPHTTGIPFGKNKELEVIKQLFDCGTLFDVMTDFREVKGSYNRVLLSEIRYRGLNCSAEDVLKDTIGGCLCIAARGEVDGGDYIYFKDGIGRIRNHIIGGKFGGEVAGAYASRVLYLASTLLTGQDVLTVPKGPEMYIDKLPEIAKPKRFNYLRIVDPLSYAYLIEALNLLQDTEFVL